MSFISGVIYGTMPSMKNSRVIGRAFKRGGGTRSILIKSAKARDYVESALKQIPAGVRLGIESDVILTVRVYYPDRRHDVDCELLCDIFQKSGILKNDRCIRVKHFYGYIDKAAPRAEWEIDLMGVQKAKEKA